MARISHASTPTSFNSSSIDFASARLGQLLARLQQTVLHADPDRERRLRISEYERARVESNLEYARTSLTKLEQDALGIKAPGRRAEVQGDLNRKRELLELLFDRLQDLKQMAVDNADDDDASSDGEDLLGEIIPTPSESMDSTSRGEASSVGEQQAEPDIPATTPQPEPPEPNPQPRSEPTSQPPRPQPTPQTQTQEAPTQTTQTLRSRTTAPSPSPNAHSTARAALFAGRHRATSPHTSTATAEAILDQQRAEQDALSDSILKMAGALKASSQKFSTTLEADKEVLSRAGEGMEKTEQGMESARGRMGMLRRMTEGKGWWGRVMLYAWVYGLMVALVLLVFVMPKLRF